MTEEEARVKQCPHKRGVFPVETRCIASDCMMWVNENNKVKGHSIGHCGLIKD
jgi:hypothetical protein